MNTPWATVWTVTLAVSLVGFALLAVKVSISGWKDLKEMLRRLGERESP